MRIDAPEDDDDDDGGSGKYIYIFQLYGQTNYNMSNKDGDSEDENERNDINATFNIDDGVEVSSFQFSSSVQAQIIGRRRFRRW